jgi:hypothetical protein
VESRLVLWVWSVASAEAPVSAVVMIVVSVVEVAKMAQLWAKHLTTQPLLVVCFVEWAAEAPRLMKRVVLGMSERLIVTWRTMG